MSQSCLKQTAASAFAHPEANLEVSGRPRHILAPKSLTAAGADVQNPSHRSFFGWVSGPAAMRTTSHLYGGSPAMSPGVMGATVLPGPGTTPPATASEPSGMIIPTLHPAPEELGTLLCTSVLLPFFGRPVSQTQPLKCLWFAHC